MGKSWRGRRHMSTCQTYPYSPAKLGGHVHIVRPRVRHQDSSPFFIGLFLDQSVQQRATREQHSSNALAQQSPRLKRLKFLRAYGCYYSSKIATLYGSSRKHLPPSLQPSLQAVEERVSIVGYPLWWGLHTRSDQLLWYIDCKIDRMCHLANAWTSPKGAMAEVPEGGADFAVARKAYFDRLEEAVEFLRAQGFAGTARCAAAAIMSCFDEAQHLSLESEADMIMQRMSEAWAALAALPPVNKLLENAQPSVDYARNRYQEAHRAVVASQAYDRALKSATRMLQRMQESPLFKSAAQRLYSVVAPYADPTLNRITGSDCYRELVDHWKPMPEPTRPEELPQSRSCVAFSGCVSETMLE